MKLKKHICFASLMFAVFFLSSSTCFAKKPLVFGSTENIEPFAYIEDKSIRGFYFDVFDEISKRAGFHVVYRLYPFKRLDNYLQNGHIDGTVCIYYKKDRESYLRYSSNPMITSRTLVFVKKGNEFPLNSVADLHGKQIGIIAGWAMTNNDYKRAKQNGKLTIQEVARYEQNLKKLITDKIDCFIMTEQLTWYHANRMGVADKISSLDMVFSVVRPYIAISKKSHAFEKPQEFMEKLNAAFQTIIDDGTYEGILKKYGVKNLN